MAGGAIERGRSVASRVTAILMAFSSGGSHSLTELAGLAGLPISTTHRLVGELVSRRVLERTDSGGYRVGLPLRMIGGGWTTQPPPLLERARDVLTDVAAVTGSTVRVGTLHGARVWVAAAGPDLPAAPAFGEDPTPPLSSAVGRALLAFSPSEIVAQVLASAVSASPELDKMRRVLATTRLSRVAVARGDDGRCAVAVPVFGTGGGLLAALEGTVPDLRAGYEAVRGVLLVAAGSLSRDLATTRPADAGVDPYPENRSDHDVGADAG